MKRGLILIVLGILLIGIGSVVAQENITCSSNADCGVASTTISCSNSTHLCTETITPTCTNPGLNESFCNNVSIVGCAKCGMSCTNNTCIEIAQTCDSTHLSLCLSKTTCESAEGEWKNGACSAEDEDDNETEDEDETEAGNGLGQIIRNRVHAGVYTSPTGEQIRVRELAQNRFLLRYNNESVDAETELEIEEETENNKTKLKVKLSNGRNAEIKIMPGVASEKALERLRLKNCVAEEGCTIELKEVGNENKQLAYELQAERHMKILAMFRAKALVKAQVDAETGEIIVVKKPWWAFLASEPVE